MNKLVALTLSAAALPALAIGTAASAQDQDAGRTLTDERGAGGQLMIHSPDGSSVPDYLARRGAQHCSAEEGANVTQNFIIGKGNGWQLSGVRQTEGWGGITWNTRP